MRPYFGGAPNAWAGGQMFAQDQRRRGAEENALNALIERFGPEAANPAALGQMQGIQQSQQLFPHHLGAAERETTAMNALTQQHGPIVGSPVAHGIQQDANANLQTAGLNFARMLQAAKTKDPTTLGAAFDRGLPVLQAMGMPTEQLAGLRERLVSDPDFVDEFASLLTNPGSRAGYMGAPIPVYDEQGRARLYDHSTGQLIQGVSPANTIQGEQRLRQGDVRLGQQNRALDQRELQMYVPSPQPGVQYMWGENGEVVGQVVAGTPQEARQQAENAERIESTRGTIAGLGNVVRASETVTRESGRILEQMGPAFDNVPAAARLAAARVPADNNPFYGVNQLIESMKANIGIDALLNIKREGAGLGQVPQSQLVTLQSLLGNLHVGRPAAELREDIAHIMELYTKIVEAGKADLQRLEQDMEQLQQGPQRSTPRAPGSRPGGGAVSGGYTPPPDIADIIGQYRR